MAKLVFIRDMCDQLAVKPTTGWRLVREREVVAVRIRGRTLATQESIDALIERSKVRPAGR